MLRSIFGILVLLSANIVFACETDILLPLVGKFEGVASIVSLERNHFQLKSPSFGAPTTLNNKSTFKLSDRNACEGFNVSIDYLYPQIVSAVTGKTVARNVSFTGISEGTRTFGLYHGKERKGRLRVIDASTFLAEFVAPNPLDQNEKNFCREFITVAVNRREIVRTIQCFNLPRTDLRQYRLVKEIKK